MKPLLKRFERSRRLFAPGGRLSGAKPVFDAAEHFFFAPADRTTTGPHVRDPLDVKRFMSMAILALAPCVIAGVYFFGLRVLAMIGVSYLAGGAVEVGVAMCRKEPINEGFLVTGLLFPLILPPTLPLWMVAVGVAFGVLVGKELFGGTGRNVFNPALVGRCYLALAYPVAMSSEWVVAARAFPGRLAQYVTPAAAEAVTAATPLGMARNGEMTGYADLFWGSVSGCVGESSALAILLGGGLLLLARVIDWRTVVAVLGAFAITAGGMHLGDPTRFVNAGWHLLAGGLLFGAFFMATDPVTSPATGGGRWAYGVLIGVVTALIRNLTGFPEGVMFAILLGNIAAPILDEIFVAGRLRRLRDVR